jgi:lipopolysaccharide export LptBFGC system permease protein LptF
MMLGAYVVAALCLSVAALSLYILARFGWVRTTRATILALVILLVLAYWEGGRATDMRGQGMIATATLMILPALVGALAGTWLGQKHRKTT